MQTKIINVTWTEPYICLQEMVAQSMHRVTVYTKGKFDQPFLIAWEMQGKGCRYV